MATQNNTNDPLGTNGLTATGRTISTILTAKGDMIAGTGPGTSGVFTPGSSYQVMVANSANASGLGWDNGLSAVNDNNRIFGYGNASSNITPGISVIPSGASTATLTANILNFVQFNIYKSTTFTQIGMEVTTSGALSAVRLGIYNVDNTGGYPGTLVVDAGTIDGTTTGVKTIAISQLLYGQYWLCFISNVSITCRAGTNSSFSDVNAWWGMNTPTVTSDAGSCRIVSGGAFHPALPATLVGNSSVVKSTINHLIYLQV